MADTHVCADPKVDYRNWVPARRLKRVVRDIVASRPNGMVINGDLAWSDGRIADYRRFMTLLQPLAGAFPLVLGMGNHDRRDNLLAICEQSTEPVPEWIAAVVEQPPFRFVQLDSQIAPGQVGGEVGDEQLAWLERLLQSALTLRTILFVHHPGESSSEGCRDFKTLLDIAERHNCVQDDRHRP